MDNEPEADQSCRLVEVKLDEASLGRASLEVEHERQVAIYDLIEQNYFELADGPKGPYYVEIAIAEQRLVFAVTTKANTEPCATFLLSLSPFRPLVKDYFMVCENYFEAIKSAPPSRIEALDMGRRALHDEGSRLLIERLDGKIKTDEPTARRLFTLICALHWRGT